MATKLFLKQPQNSFSTATAYKYSTTTPSVLVFTTSVTNKINGTTQCTLTAGGAAVAWISPPIAAAVTISGTITYNAYVKTSSTTGAPKTIGRVFKYSGGSESQISTKTSVLTQSTAIQLDNFTDTAPTATAFAVDDRIVMKWFVSSTSATGTETHDYGGKTAAADGDEWVQFTEAITFKSEPEFIQTSGQVVTTVSGATVAATLPGATAAGNMILALGTILTQAETISGVSDGSSYTSEFNNVNWNGSTDREGFFHRVNVGASTYTVTLTKSASNTTGRAINVYEYGGVTSSPTDITANTPLTGNNTTPASSASGTTNFPNELVIGILDYAGTNVPIGGTPGNSLVNRSTTDGGILADKVVTSAASYTASWTITSQQWIASVATFKAAFQDLSVTATGASATFTGGTVTPTGGASITATGNSATFSGGTVTPAAGASLTATGRSISASGGTITPTGGANITATGQSIAASGGSVTVSGNANVTVTGNSITATGGTVSVGIGITVTVTGQQIIASGGSVSITGGSIVSLTGRSITATGGSVTLAGDASVVVTGKVIAASSGSVTVSGNATITVSGNQITAVSGIVTVTVSGGIVAIHYYPVFRPRRR